MLLPMFLFEAATAEALIAKNLVCQKSGMIFKVEEFKAPPSIMRCFHCQGFGHPAQNCRKHTANPSKLIEKYFLDLRNRFLNQENISKFPQNEKIYLVKKTFLVLFVRNFILIKNSLRVRMLFLK